MSSPPTDRLEYWVRFVCVFIIFGAIVFLLFLRYSSSFSLVSLTVPMSITLLICHYAARVGDEAWYRLINLFRWW